MRCVSMMKKMLFPILFILILLGCMTDDDTLDFPRSLNLNNEVLSWNAVENATSYTINIDGVEYDSTELSFDLNFLDNGSYEIKILTNQDDESSEYSPVFNVVFERDYTAPQNVMVVDDIFLTWDAMESVTSYSVWMDDEEIAITWVASYDLSLLSLITSQYHSFQVTGNYGVHSTLKSSSVGYVNFPLGGDAISATYTLNQIEDVVIAFEGTTTVDYVWFEGNFISSDLYSQTVDTQLELDPSIFSSFNVGIYNLRLLTSTGYIVVDLSVINPE